jgi:hypothetical protein
MDTTGARTIVPLMVFAVGITLVGHTLAPTKSTKLSPQVGDAQILLGGTIATVILTLLASSGDVGSRFGKGVALVALVSSVAAYGKDVVGGIDKATGQTTPTTPTKPTVKGAAKP